MSSRSEKREDDAEDDAESDDSDFEDDGDDETDESDIDDGAEEVTEESDIDEGDEGDNEASSPLASSSAPPFEKRESAVALSFEKEKRSSVEDADEDFVELFELNKELGELGGESDMKRIVSDLALLEMLS